MVHLNFATLQEPISKDLFEKYMLELPTSMQVDILRFRRWEDSHTSLLGKIMLKNIATRIFNMPDILHHIRYSAFNKPELLGPISFNISHSKKAVVCVMSQNLKVGVDLEHVESIDFTHFKEHMTDQEWDQILKAKDPKWKFFSFWTQKESAIKADGRGLSLSLKELEVQHSRLIIENKTWHLKELKLLNGYCCSIASDQPLGDQDMRLEEFLVENRN